MAKEHLEVLNDNSDRLINIQYEPPTLPKRVFSNFLDLIFLFLTFILAYIGVQAIVRATPDYKGADATVAYYRKESGLFEYSLARETWENISTYLDNNNDTSYDFRVSRCQTAIDDFLVYIKTNFTEHYDAIKKDYDNARLSSRMVDSKGTPLFVWSDAHLKPAGEKEACLDDLGTGTLTFTAESSIKDFMIYLYEDDVKKESVSITQSISESGIYSLDLSSLTWVEVEGVQMMSNIQLVRTGDQPQPAPLGKIEITINLDLTVFDSWAGTVTKPSIFVRCVGEPKIIKNPASTANARYYYDLFYQEYTLTNCGGFMIQVIGPYRDALMFMSNMLFFVQFPIAALISGFLIYLLPGLIIKRGRPTLGKRLMQIQFVDPQILSPSARRYVCRWLVFFFLEFVLSFFTFGIPFIVSFTMTLATKKHQSFPDFMTGLVEVDAKKQKVYFTRYEVSLDNAPIYQDPVDFKIDQKD